MKNLGVSEKKVKQKRAKSAVLGVRVQKEELNFIFIVEKCSIPQEEMLKTKPKVSESLRKMRGLGVGHGVGVHLQQSHSYEGIYLIANRIKLCIHTLQV